MSNIVNDVVASLEKDTKAYMEKAAELSALQAKINSDDYAESLKREWRVKANSLRDTMEIMKKNAGNEARKIYDDKIEELRIADMPKSEELTDDVKLLNSGVKLTRDEVIYLLQKQENKNPTMHRLIMQYANEHKMDIPQEERVYINNHSAIMQLEGGKSAINYYLRWFDKPNAIDMLYKMYGDYLD